MKFRKARRWSKPKSSAIRSLGQYSDKSWLLPDIVLWYTNIYENNKARIERSESPHIQCGGFDLFCRVGIQSKF
jgi:hypothetical protein